MNAAAYNVKAVDAFMAFALPKPQTQCGWVYRGGGLEIQGTRQTWLDSPPEYTVDGVWFHGREIRDWARHEEEIERKFREEGGRE